MDCNQTDIELPTSGYISTTTYDGYSMIWNDEFNTNQLDDSKWSYHLGNGCPNLCWWGNNELQSFTNRSENLHFQDGNLIMTAIHENYQGHKYTSSRIHTDDKFEFRYGRIDIRAAMPSAFGSWTALWMLNKNYSVEDPGSLWPSGGEIDIVEFLGEDPDDAFGTAHYGTNLANHRFNSKHYTSPNQNYDEEFYVYSIIWEEDKITWLINNVAYHSISPGQVGNQPYPFNDQFFLLFSLSVGGNLPKAPTPEDYPGHLIID